MTRPPRAVRRSVRPEKTRSRSPAGSARAGSGPDLTDGDVKACIRFAQKVLAAEEIHVKPLRVLRFLFNRDVYDLTGDPEKEATRTLQERAKACRARCARPAAGGVP